MPARERFYPGTVWQMADLPEIPVEFRGQRVKVLAEVEQDEDLSMHAWVGFLDPEQLEFVRADLGWLQ